ncbi:hypothetical protein ACIA5C_45975 [Actinoplanes sp. NPDC051343]|uniref:hypothetical protein n=1 Tax=Actinoplanes sp. NPDC051343 TaxID=3363906 RepID=UPI00378AA147
MFLGRRVRAVPDRSAVTSIGPRHSFGGNKKPSGDDPSEHIAVDAGIFFAVGSAQNINGVVRFGDHYRGRAATSEVVWDEVTRKANSTDVSQRPIMTAARSSQRYLLAGGRVQRKELDPYASAALLESVHQQLVQLDRAQHGTSDIGSMEKHSGEAELIVLAQTEHIGTLLTNDAGASVVAASQHPAIRALNFADVLMELTCASAGEIDAATATVTFEHACTISNITATAKPRDPATFFACGQSGEPGSVCSRCA